jgi:hypothetical protein
MKNIFLRSLAGAAMAVAPMALTTTAFADAPITHPYQVQGSTSCSGQGVCDIVFPAITTGGHTVIQHVSCSFFMPTGSAVSASVSINGTIGPSTVSNMLPIINYGGGAWAIAGDTTLYLAKNNKPQLNLITENGGVAQNLTCTLTGYY